jgi:hypothetical protein
MFDATASVQIYAEALKRIATGSYDLKQIYLHDWGEEIYRSKEGYTDGGIHWGYADNIASEIADKSLPGATDCIRYAMFVGSRSRGTTEASENWNFKSNRRYKVIVFDVVKDRVVAAIQRKIAKANVVAEAKFLASWREIVQKDFGQYLPAAMRIDVVNAKGRVVNDTPKSRHDTSNLLLRIVALRPERFDTYGMGSFLTPKPGEVSISPFAVRVLRDKPSLSGLQGAELHSEDSGQSHLGYLGTAAMVTLPLNRVNASLHFDTDKAFTIQI